MSEKRTNKTVKWLLFLLPNPHSDEIWGLKVLRFCGMNWQTEMPPLWGGQCHHADKSTNCWFTIQIEGSASDE